MSFAGPSDVGEYIILYHVCIHVDVMMMYHIIVSYTSLVIFSPNVYTSSIAQAVRAFLIAMMLPCAPSSSVAAGSFPALDIAVVDSLLAADLQAIEAYIRDQHTGVSWHLVLNNHASTRPEVLGGPLVPAVTDCKTYQKIEAGSATSFWRCILQLPNSFQPNDGRRLESVGEGHTKEDASEDACRKAFAKLLYAEPSNVVLRPKHWKIAPDEVVASLPRSRRSHQALPVHISARQENAGAQAAVLSRSERDAHVTDLIRLCLNTHEGEFDPSTICHQKTGLRPEEERVGTRLNQLLRPGELNEFIARHPEFAWRAVNPTWRHPLGVASTAMLIT